MFCPKCGLQVTEGATFCPQCGERLPDSATNNPLTAVEAMSVPDSGSLQTPDSAGPHAATAISAPQMLALGRRTSRMPIIIVAAVVAICAAGVLVFGFFQGWFSSNSVYVPSERSVHLSGRSEQQIETQYDRDGNGNLLAEHSTLLAEHSTGTGPSGGSIDVSYSFDGNGYVTSLNLSAPFLQSAYQVTFVNDIDDRGRLTATRLQSQDLGSLTAKYSYLGDTDILESIQYTDYESGPDDDGSGSHAASEGYVVSASDLTDILPDSFDPTHGAFLHFVFGGNSYQIRYSEDGARQATIINGKSFEAMTLEELRGNTVETGSDSSTVWATTSNTYDDNGYLTHRVTTAKENAENIAQGVDPDYKQEIHISYARIPSPSKAVSIFGRLRG